MLQRIQSLYLIASLILYGILILTPLFYLQTDEVTYTLFSYKIIPEQNTLNINVIPLSIILGITSFILLISIFLYKNRKIQIRLLQCNLVIVLISLIIIGIYLYSFSILSADAHIRFTLSISIPFVVSVLQYMAIGAIKKDQLLVDSLNRLR